MKHMKETYMTYKQDVKSDPILTTMCLSTATRTVIQKRPIRPIIEFNERKL